MRSAGSWWLAGSLLVALAACAVGGSDGDTSRPRRDAGTDASGDRDDAADGEDEEDAGGKAGAGGQGGEGGDGGGNGEVDGGGGTDGGAGSGDGGTCAPPAASGKCDPIAQCGCNADQNCDFSGATDGRTICIPAGTTPAWHSCDDFGQCEKGLGCVSQACKPFCEQDADCSASGGKCGQLYIDQNGSAKPIEHAKACSTQCDLRQPGLICGPGVSCVLIDDDGSTDCVGGFGTATGAGACAGNAGMKCAPGHICINQKDCLKWCRVGYAGDCAGGQKCYQLDPPLDVRGIAYGVCDT